MITFQEEALELIIDELSVIIKKTWDEVDQRGNYFNLDPNWEMYFRLNNNGNVKFITARDDGRMVGYFVVFIHEDLHAKGNLQAVSDVIYIDDDYRGKGITDMMINFAEGILVSLGVRWFSIALKDFQRHDSLMDKIGYKHFENVYQKYLN